MISTQPPTRARRRGTRTRTPRRAEGPRRRPPRRAGRRRRKACGGVGSSSFASSAPRRSRACTTRNTPPTRGRPPARRGTRSRPGRCTRPRGAVRSRRRRIAPRGPRAPTRTFDSRRRRTTTENRRRRMPSACRRSLRGRCSPRQSGTPSPSTPSRARRGALRASCLSLLNVGSASARSRWSRRAPSEKLVENCREKFNATTALPQAGEPLQTRYDSAAPRTASPSTFGNALPRCRLEPWARAGVARARPSAMRRTAPGGCGTGARPRGR